jgi:hypothetical protein
MDDFKRLGCASVQLYPFSPEARKNLDEHLTY